MQNVINFQLKIMWVCHSKHLLFNFDADNLSRAAENSSCCVSRMKNWFFRLLCLMKVKWIFFLHKREIFMSGERGWWTWSEGNFPITMKMKLNYPCERQEVNWMLLTASLMSTGKGDSRNFSAISSIQFRSLNSTLNQLRWDFDFFIHFILFLKI